MYRLEIEYFGEWDLVKEFDSPELAHSYGMGNMSQNRWRVVDREMTNDGHFRYEEYHDPMVAIAALGEQDLERFQRSSDWSAGMARRSESRERMHQARLARAASGIEERLTPLPMHQRIAEIADEEDWEEEADFYDSNYEKVNWMKEGF